MKTSTSPSASALLLVAAFAWSGSARGMDCACEVATGACVTCCGNQDAGFKHCGHNDPNNPNTLMHSTNPMPPPVMKSTSPESPDKSVPAAGAAGTMNVPAPELLDVPKAAIKHPAADYRDSQENKQDKTISPAKSAAPKQAPDAPGKDMQ